MTIIDSINNLQLLTHKETADRFRICTRTLDRWILKGAIPAPLRVNRRKYHLATVVPRHDDDKDVR
jgi:hypothetical protein